jgi:hypothetical protein
MTQQPHLTRRRFHCAHTVLSFHVDVAAVVVGMLCAWMRDVTGKVLTFNPPCLLLPRWASGSLDSALTNARAVLRAGAAGAVSAVSCV